MRSRPTLPLTPLPFPYVVSVVGTSRCDVRAACSGATPSNASAARSFVPPATTWAGTAQRAVPTITLNTYDWGNRFLCTQDTAVYQVVLPQNYLERNPFLTLSETTRRLVPGATSKPDRTCLSDCAVRVTA